MNNTSDKPFYQRPACGLLARGFELKTAIDARREELAAINLELLARAVFPAGKATCHIQEGKYKARIVKKENIKYDQEKLLEIKQRMPAIFEQVFKLKYEPEAAALKTFMAADQTFAQAIAWARSVTPAAPSVTYEKTQDGERGNDGHFLKFLKPPMPCQPEADAGQAWPAKACA